MFFAVIFSLALELKFVLLKGLKNVKDTVTSCIGLQITLLWGHSNVCNCRENWWENAAGFKVFFDY